MRLDLVRLLIVRVVTCYRLLLLMYKLACQVATCYFTYFLSLVTFQAVTCQEVTCYLKFPDRYLLVRQLLSLGFWTGSYLLGSYFLVTVTSIRVWQLLFKQLLVKFNNQLGLQILLLVRQLLFMVFNLQLLFILLKL